MYIEADVAVTSVLTLCADVLQTPLQLHLFNVVYSSRFLRKTMFCDLVFTTTEKL